MPYVHNIAGADLLEACIHARYCSCGVSTNDTYEEGLGHVPMVSFFVGTMEIEPLSPKSATYFSLPLMKSADIPFCEDCRSTLAARPIPSNFCALSDTKD